MTQDLFGEGRVLRKKPTHQRVLELLDYEPETGATKEEAGQAYADAAARLHGQFARVA